MEGKPTIPSELNRDLCLRSMTQLTEGRLVGMVAPKVVAKE